MGRRNCLRQVAWAVVFAGALGVAPLAVAQQPTKLKLGVVTALTGPLAAPGKFQMNGFNLAVEEINGKGGVEVGGRRYELELQVYDTRCNPAEGASAMQRLTTVDRVPVILGELCSQVVQAEAPIAQDNETPLILTVTTGPNLTKQKNPYVFRVNSHNDQLSVALADFVAKQGWSPIAFIAWNNDAGRGGVNGMRQIVPPAIKLGYTGYFNVGEVDFSSHIANIRAEKSQAVMLLMDEEPGSLAIAQIRAANVPISLIGTLAMGSDRFLQRLDAARLAGMVQYNSFPPNAEVPRIKNFSTRYKAKFGEEAHGFAAQSYDGIFIAAAALRAAGTVTSGKAVRDALAKTKMEGVTGTLEFDAEGQANPPVYVTQWCDNGTRKIVYPAELAAGCGSG